MTNVELIRDCIRCRQNSLACIRCEISFPEYSEEERAAMEATCAAIERQIERDKTELQKAITWEESL